MVLINDIYSYNDIYSFEICIDFLQWKTLTHWQKSTPPPPNYLFNIQSVNENHFLI